MVWRKCLILLHADHFPEVYPSVLILQILSFVSSSSHMWLGWRNKLKFHIRVFALDIARYNSSNLVLQYTTGSFKIIILSDNMRRAIPLRLKNCSKIKRKEMLDWDGAISTCTARTVMYVNSTPQRF